MEVRETQASSSALTFLGGFNSKDPHYTKIVTKLTDTAMKKYGSSYKTDPLHLKKQIEQDLSNFFPKFHTPEHPTYYEMIRTAIAELGEQDGSTEEAISSYIRDKYEDLPCAHATILRYQLQHLNRTGKIIRVSETNYLLPTNVYESDELNIMEEKWFGGGEECSPECVQTFEDNDQNWTELVIIDVGDCPQVEELLDFQPADGERMAVFEEQMSVEKEQIEADEQVNEAQEQPIGVLKEQDIEHCSQVELIIDHHPAKGNWVAAVEELKHVELDIDVPLIQSCDQCPVQEKEVVVEEDIQGESVNDLTLKKGCEVRVQDQEVAIDKYISGESMDDLIQKQGSEVGVQEKEVVVEENVSDESTNDLIEKQGHEVQGGCDMAQQSELLGDRSEHNQEVADIVDQVLSEEELIGSIEKLFKLYERQSRATEEQNEKEVNNIHYLSLQKFHSSSPLQSPRERCKQLLKKTRKIEDKLLDVIFVLSAAEGSGLEGLKASTESEQNQGDLETQKLEAKAREELQHEPQPTPMPSPLQLTTDTNRNKLNMEQSDSIKDDAVESVMVSFTSLSLVPNQIPEMSTQEEPKTLEEFSQGQQEPQKELQGSFEPERTGEKITNVIMPASLPLHQQNQMDQPKRKRGRPPKKKLNAIVKTITEATISASVDAPVPSQPQHRRRGRPPKPKFNAIADTSTEGRIISLLDSTTTLVIDVPLPFQQPNQMEQPNHRRQGRPPKRKVDASMSYEFKLTSEDQKQPPSKLQCLRPRKPMSMNEMNLFNEANQRKNMEMEHGMLFLK